MSTFSQLNCTLNSTDYWLGIQWQPWSSSSLTYRKITKARGEKYHSFESTRAKKDWQTFIFSKTRIIGGYKNAMTMVWVIATKTSFSCVFFDARLTAPLQLPYVLTLQIVQGSRKQWLSSSRSWSGSEGKKLNCGRKRWKHLSSLFSAKPVTGIFPTESPVVWLCTPGCSFLPQISRPEGSTADLTSKEQALTLGELSSPKIISMVEMTKRWPWLWQAPPSQPWHSQGDQHQGLTWIPHPHEYLGS